MFGKGAKRKLDEDEEGLEGKALASPVAGGLGLGPEGLSKVSYTLQRQTIFNISLMKLYSQRPLGSEPSLERRVLINNMLRRIQDELKQEGSLRPLLLPPSPPPDDPMDEGFREAPSSFQLPQQSALLAASAMAPPTPHPQAAPASASAPQSCLTPASLLEEDGHLAFCTLSPPPTPSALLAQAPPRVPPLIPSLPGDAESGPPAAIARTAAANTTTTSLAPPLPLAQPPRLSPPPSLAAPCQPRDGRTTAGPKLEAAGTLLGDGRPVEVRTTDDLAGPPPPPPGPVGFPPVSHPSPPSPSSPSGFLSDLALDDILFADIDTSMYDYDPCTTAGTGGVAGGGGLSKLSPAVVTADDLLKSLASPYSGPAPQVSANQPFKIDLTELDHIMEVLVGS